MTIVKKSDGEGMPLVDAALGQDADKAGLNTHESHMRVLAPPPTYNEAMSSSSSRQPELPPASNLVTIHKPNGAIKGIWAIDTSLRVPEALLPPLPCDTQIRHNLSLCSSNGGIAADVALLSGKPERASMFLETKNGSVKLNVIACHNDQPFKVFLKSYNGAIHVQLPRSFTGPLKYHTSNGSYEFSPEMRTRLREVSSECSFLGSWDASGFTDYESWNGCELEAFTYNGSIKFSYVGEDPSLTESKGGRFLWWKW